MAGGAAVSADTLRRAAALMRERAMRSCPDGAWYDQGDLHDALYPLADTMDDPQADAEHIASWHPAVALAVANLLTDLAVDYEDGVLDDTTTDDALAVARAYLGSDS